MKNTDVNIKKSILRLLGKLDQDVSKMTVSEMKYNFEETVEAYERETRDQETNLIDEFSNTYLKHQTEDGLFGKELEILHVTSLKFESYSTEYEKLYKLEGERISFNRINVYKGELTMHNNFVSEENLRSYNVITKDDYDKYVAAYENMNDALEEIINR